MTNCRISLSYFTVKLLIEVLNCPPFDFLISSLCLSSDIHRQPSHLPENTTAADPVYRRACRTAPGEGSRVSRPSQRYRQGWRPWTDLETQPSVRHEVPDAGRIVGCLTEVFRLIYVYVARHVATSPTINSLVSDLSLLKKPISFTVLVLGMLYSLFHRLLRLCNWSVLLWTVLVCYRVA